jgi:hypothetical protein
MNENNRIDVVPIRMSTHATHERQTPKGTDFGSRLRNGINVATGLASSVAAPIVPGGSIVAAAISGISGAGSSPSSGQRVGETTLAAHGGSTKSTLPSSTGQPNAGIPSQSGLDELSATGSSMVAEQASANIQYLHLQRQVQLEDQKFQTLSNVMKNRHDTLKNTIANVK